jgi:hypothetical protein
MGQGFGRMDVHHPHFLKHAPTLGSVKSSICHEDWRFHFLSNFIFPKFRVHLDYHIYYWDFCFTKKLRSLKIPQDLLVLWKFLYPSSV